MKPVTFLGDSLARLRDFPDDARSEAGHQLSEVQCGNDPDDWKPMKAIGAGVREIRIRDSSGAFRIIYLATCPTGFSCCMLFGKRHSGRRKKMLSWRRAA